MKPRAVLLYCAIINFGFQPFQNEELKIVISNLKKHIVNSKTGYTIFILHV